MPGCSARSHIVCLLPLLLCPYLGNVERQEDKSLTVRANWLTSNLDNEEVDLSTLFQSLFQCVILHVPRIASDPGLDGNLHRGVVIYQVPAPHGLPGHMSFG